MPRRATVDGAAPTAGVLSYTGCLAECSKGDYEVCTVIGLGHRQRTPATEINSAGRSVGIVAAFLAFEIRLGVAVSLGRVLCET